MLYGDISNQWSPAIVIDIDDLIIEVPKESVLESLGRVVAKNKLNLAQLDVRRYKLKKGIYPLLENIFIKDIAIYLFAHRPTHYQEPLEKLFQDLPITRVYTGGVKEREEVLSRSHVHWYYYNHREHASILSKHKERWVEAWNDISL